MCPRVQSWPAVEQFSVRSIAWRRLSRLPSSISGPLQKALTLAHSSSSSCGLRIIQMSSYIAHKELHISIFLRDLCYLRGFFFLFLHCKLMTCANFTGYTGDSILMVEIVMKCMYLFNLFFSSPHIFLLLPSGLI